MFELHFKTWKWRKIICQWCNTYHAKWKVYSVYLLWSWKEVITVILPLTKLCHHCSFFFKNVKVFDNYKVNLFIIFPFSKANKRCWERLQNFFNASQPIIVEPAIKYPSSLIIRSYKCSLQNKTIYLWYMQTRLHFTYLNLFQ